MKLHLVTIFCVFSTFIPWISCYINRPTIVIREKLSRKSKMAPLAFSSGIDLSIQIYDAQLWATNVFETTLSKPSVYSFILLYFSGLLTAFSPCVLGLLPLTLAYLGIDDASSETYQLQLSQDRLLKASSYAIGLSTMFSIFGLSAAFLGKALNPSSTAGAVSGLLVSMLTVCMGLNLLELVQFSFPDLSNILPSTSTSESKSKLLSSIVQPALFGASSAFVACPCSSPVLASLIAIIGSSGEPIQGASFLFAYSIGYVSPVITAGAVSGSISSMFSKYRNSVWINELFASLLITFGTYKALESIQSLIA